MFERFGQDLRTALVLGVEAAKQVGHSEIRPEHLLVGLAGTPEAPVAAVLAAHGLDEPTARRLLAQRPATPIDGDALAAIGIDLEQVRASIEQSFGEGALDQPRRKRRFGHIPFDPSTKRVFHDAIRRLGKDRRAGISGTHLLLVLLDGDDPGVRDVLDRADVDRDALRRDVERRTRGAA